MHLNIGYEATYLNKRSVEQSCNFTCSNQKSALRFLTKQLLNYMRCKPKKEILKHLSDKFLFSELNNKIFANINKRISCNIKIRRFPLSL